MSLVYRSDRVDVHLGDALDLLPEKPVALLRELIESSSRQGETVLDPFAGVGSTGVAAILAGRRAVLVEVKPEFAELAADRCRRAEALVDQAVGL